MTNWCERCHDDFSEHYAKVRGKIHGYCSVCYAELKNPPKEVGLEELEDAQFDFAEESNPIKRFIKSKSKGD
jgi:hypothetical protein